MNRRLRLPLIALTACAPFVCANLHAVPVTNWHTFRAATATTLSGQGTSSPVYGSTALTANGSFLVGYFDAISLTNLGDRITFSFQVSFTDAAGFTGNGDNFRFALYDLNGQTPVTTENTLGAGVDGQTDNWRGYWFGNKGGGGAGINGSIRERNIALTSATDNPFSNTAGDPAPSLGPVGGSAVALQSSTSPAGGLLFVGVMALEKTPSGVALAGILGGNGATNVFTANDNASPFPVNYGAVGYLDGSGLSCDQMNFQNVTVAYLSSNALQITSQPTNVTVIAGQTAQFRVSWSGSGLIPYFQWRENGTDILDATNSTYTTPATVSGQNGNTFSVVVSNVFSDSVTSSNAILTVITDTNAPLVLSVSSLISNSLNVVFSEPVDPTTSQDGSSYTLAGNTFSAITLIGGTNVQITVDNPITTNYTLSVQNVKDVAGNTMTATNLAGIAHGFQASLGIGISDGLGFAFNDDAVVHAGGLNIFGTSDQFQYVYKPISGDFDLAVRVESLLNTDQNARAGLMARLNTFFDSRNVLIEATPGRFIFQYRTNNAEATLAVSAPRPPTAFPNSWLRLVRSGSVFTGYSSTNYGVWDLIASHDTAIGTDGAYPSDILIGLAVSSANVSQITRAQFSGFGRAVIRPTLTVVPAGGNVEVSWPLASLGFTLQATPSLTPTITWTNVPGSTTTNRVFVSTGASALFFRAILE